MCDLVSICNSLIQLHYNWNMHEIINRTHEKYFARALYSTILKRLTVITTITLTKISEDSSITR